MAVDPKDRWLTACFDAATVMAITRTGRLTQRILIILTMEKKAPSNYDIDLLKFIRRTIQGTGHRMGMVYLKIAGITL
jgi:hypothetical protein